MVVSLSVIVFLFPIMLLIGIIIKMESEGPLFFKQTRIGLNSQPFVIYKFRTMTITAPSNVPTNSLADPDLYLTRVGRVLRKTSLDELPQLINVLKNEMSLIGPRPVIPIEKELIGRRRELGVDQILPGVTGYAQINGRDKLNYIEKSDYDLIYLQKMSLGFDLGIIFSTIFKIAKSEHINH